MKTAIFQSLRQRNDLHRLALAAVIGAGAPALGDTFTWMGDCESNSPFACCPVDPEDPCEFDKNGDPIEILFTNNWGAIGPCGECPTADQFPGGDDDIDLIDAIVPLDGGTFTFGMISSDADAGGLIMTNAGLVVPGPIQVFSLDMTGGSVTTEDTLQVSEFFASPGQTLSAAEYLILDLIKLGQLGSGGTSHTFNDGKVVSEGQVIWEAGSILAEGGWNHIGETFEINAESGQFNRSFNGGPLNNHGTLEVNRADSGGAGGHITMNVPLITAGDSASIVTTEAADLRLNGGGVYDSPQPLDMFGNSRILYAGFGDGFVFLDGTLVRDLSDEGEQPTIEIVRATIANDAEATVEPLIIVNNNGEFNVLGVLTADSVQLESFSDTNGNGTGMVTTQQFDFAGQAIELNGVTVEVTETFDWDLSPANGLTLNDAQIQVGPGASGELAGKYVLVAVDSDGDIASITVSQSEFVNDEPLEVTGLSNAAGDQTFSLIDSTWTVDDDVTFSSFVDKLDVDGGAITVQEEATFDIKTFLDIEAGANITNCGLFLSETGANITNSNFLNKAHVVFEDDILLLDTEFCNLFDAFKVEFRNGFAQFLGLAQWKNEAVAEFENMEVESNQDFINFESGVTMLENSTWAQVAGTFSNGGQMFFDGSSLHAEPGADVTNEETGIYRCTGGENTFTGPLTNNGECRAEGQGTVMNVGSTDGANPATVTGDGNLAVASGATACVQPGSNVECDEINVSDTDSEFCVTDGFVSAKEATAGNGTKVIFSFGQMEFDMFFLQLFSDLFVDGNGLAGGSASVVSINKTLSFEMTDEANWFWGPDSVLALTGGVGSPIGDWENWTRLEVGGTDLGDTTEGFNHNFDLSILRIGEGAHAFLEDVIDNGNRGGGGGAATGVAPEALYVDVLEFADADGLLNVNGLNIYFGELIGDPSQIIDEPTVTPGDLDGDNDVDVVDLLTLLGQWGACPEPPAECPADIDNSGDVNVSDLLTLLSNWG